MKVYLLFMTLAAVLFAEGLTLAEPEPGLVVTPVEHASFVLQTQGGVIYVDPVGEKKAYESLPGPDMILLTDIHQDHLAPELIAALKQDKTEIVGPKAVIDKLGYGQILQNGEITMFSNMDIEAVPMYNMTPDRLNFHEKGRGNGYVITLTKARVYISGDTEDIPEMRKLQDIDYAFVCMNLPYTMTVQQAASAVLQVKPKVVYPYHYRGKGGVFSDVNEFKRLVAKDPGIVVRLLDWYK